MKSLASREVLSETKERLRRLTPEELSALYTVSIALIAIVVVAAAFGWLWTLRRSRFPML